MSSKAPRTADADASCAVRTSKTLGEPRPYCARACSNGLIAGKQRCRKLRARRVRPVFASVNSARNRFSLIVVSALAVDNRITIASSAAAVHALSASAWDRGILLAVSLDNRSLSAVRIRTESVRSRSMKFAATRSASSFSATNPSSF